MIFDKVIKGVAQFKLKENLDLQRRNGINIWTKQNKICYIVLKSQHKRISRGLLALLFLYSCQIYFFC